MNKSLIISLILGSIALLYNNCAPSFQNNNKLIETNNNSEGGPSHTQQELIYDKNNQTFKLLFPKSIHQSIVLHDDFDKGVSGDPLEGWNLSSSHGNLPEYSNTSSITGEISGLSNFTGEGFNSSAEFKKLNGLKQVYLSYYVKVIHLNGERSRNIKLARITAGYKGSYLQPSTGITLFHNYKNGIGYMGPGAEKDNYTEWFGNYVDGNWHRVEHIVRLSSLPGSTDGFSYILIDGQYMQKLDNIITDHFGNSFEWLTLPYYAAHSPGGDYQILYDNVFLSNTPARIEACQSSEYHKCKQPYVIETIDWTHNQATFKANLKSEDVYVYLFDQNNDLLNTDGIKLNKN